MTSRPTAGRRSTSNGNVRTTCAVRLFLTVSFSYGLIRG